MSEIVKPETEQFQPDCMEGDDNSYTGQIARLKAENARLSTALENARKDAWQPIETAPRDGSKFLGLTSAGDCAIVSRHDPGGEKRNPKHHYETWVCDFNSHLVEPTHWQPLPQPPSLTPPKEKAT